MARRMYEGSPWAKPVALIGGAVLTLGTVLFASYMSNNYVFEKVDEEKIENIFHENEKSKLDSAYQVQLDSLREVHENKLEKISQE